MRGSELRARVVGHPLIVVAATVAVIWGLLIAVSLSLFSPHSLDTSRLPPAMIRDFAVRRLADLCYQQVHKPETLILSASDGRDFQPDLLEKLAPGRRFHVLQIPGANIGELGNLIAYLSACSPAKSNAKRTYVVISSRYVYADITAELRPHVRPILTETYIREKSAAMHAPFSQLPLGAERVAFRLVTFLAWPRYLADYTREEVKRLYRKLRYDLATIRHPASEPKYAGPEGIGLDRQKNFGQKQLLQMLRIRDLIRAAGARLVVIDMPFDPAYEKTNLYVVPWRHRVRTFLRSNEICILSGQTQVPHEYFDADQLHPALDRARFWNLWLLATLGQSCKNRDLRAESVKK